MATENDSQDNVGDGGPIHASGPQSTGKIKVALVDPSGGTLMRKVKIDWNTVPCSCDKKSTDEWSEVVFDIPNNATKAEIGVEQPCRVRAISFVGLHSISTIVLS